MAGSGGAGGSGLNCGTLSRSAVFLPADILILLDRSESMSNDIDDRTCMSAEPPYTTVDCGQRSKWGLTTSVIQQVVTASKSSTKWGLKYFADPGNATCSVSANVAVAPGLDNAAAITASIAEQTNSSGGLSNGSLTPTRAAVRAATAYLTSLNDSNPKYILLATAGLPNCAPGGGDTTTDDSAAAIAAVQTAFNSGIYTFVVGIATEGGPAEATLNQMALAGGVPHVGSTAYYPVSTPAELTSGFQTLLGVSDQSCTFSLGALPTSDGRTSYDAISLFADGTYLPRDTSHSEGWDYADATHQTIVLFGATCAGVQSHAIQTVTVNFNCLWDV